MVSKKVGISLIIISTVLWIGTPIIPFLPVSGTVKIAAASIILVIAEVLFWIGTVLTGKELVKKYKDKIKQKFLKIIE